ncbi:MULTISPECIES: hypothetical protein [Gordonia]|uniref:hypothetical protein n=1 Tax=Gordonia otitidis TaxID=249058 RepID=UPI00111054C2|nr:hypothetical protein [Gordonia otitidis]
MDDDRPDSGSQDAQGKDAARLEQLKRRRQRLADGEPATAETAAAAAAHARESMTRAVAAHASAAQRHDDAVLAHERAASIHAMAAERSAPGRGLVHRESAEVRAQRR